MRKYKLLLETGQTLTHIKTNTQLKKGHEINYNNKRFIIQEANKNNLNVQPIGDAFIVMPDKKHHKAINYINQNKVMDILYEWASESY